MLKNTKRVLLTAMVSAIGWSGAANATYVKVEVSSLFAEGGLAITPVWMGFHDGSFDSFDAGSAASAELQALAENGDTSGISASFTASHADGVQGTLAAFGGMAPVFEPGESATSDVFEVDAASSGYFSFLSMLIPTNDGFIGNDDAMAYSLFDMMGEFQDLDILVLGSSVWDSGTELNRGFGSPFLVGADGEARQDENGVVGFHTGLDVLPGGLAIIGGSTPTGYTIDEMAADFTQQGFEVARIQIREVPDPAIIGVFALSAFGVAALRRKRGQTL
ncbi:PEP-CTERM sorting domain-containing protein [Corallincola luteus]|uniref:PEP-CTERM sorting domain-containing protein n=1 Tax=Corallincola luteus TaxID=1775177 RepID=A0ABY2ALC5_9GAMM|nr:spondin domain-containing protein [Corallincola luteus]TCI02039.1 PEP-CTERM sorting domain-containing protein [Corallincola luteus]